MKLKDLDEKAAARYLKIEEDELQDISQDIQMALAAAKQYVVHQTGVEMERLEEQEDITYAVLVLVQDMIDNRRFYVDNQNVNKVVDSIINQYAENLV